jgi:hypothetical protein
MHVKAGLPPGLYLHHSPCPLDISATVARVPSADREAQHQARIARHAVIALLRLLQWTSRRSFARPAMLSLSLRLAFKLSFPHGLWRRQPTGGKTGAAFPVPLHPFKQQAGTLKLMSARHLCASASPPIDFLRRIIAILAGDMLGAYPVSIVLTG